MEVKIEHAECSIFHTGYNVFVGDHQIFVIYTDDPVAVDKWIRHVRRVYKKHGDHLIVGIDVIRPLEYGKRGVVDTEFSDIVLCVGSHCLIYSDFLFSFNCRSSPVTKVLREFLANPKVSFVGLNIGFKAEKLKRHFGRRFSVVRPKNGNETGLFIANPVELKPLTKNVLGLDYYRKDSGVANLAKKVFKQEVEMVEQTGPLYRNWGMSWDEMMKATFETYLAFKVGCKEL